MGSFQRDERKEIRELYVDRARVVPVASANWVLLRNAAVSLGKRPPSYLLLHFLARTGTAVR